MLILIVGFALRFSASFIHSYSNDELSAVSRLRYSNFSDLIEFGVQKGDMHPAGVQVFMKGWSLLFGKSEIAMRFPFVLFGTLAIYVLFLIGKQWFNRKVGIIAAGLLALLYFPIMNSEFARPYSPGLLISLLAGYFLYKVLFDDTKQLRNAIILGICFAAGMYTHYFTFLFLGFIGATGLLFLTKDNWKYYALAGGLGILLFLPHLQVTIHHLSVGGLQWLAPPSFDWLPRFLFHALNSSWAVVGVILGMVFIGLQQKRKDSPLIKRNVFIPVLWFFGIYIVGHIMSYLSTPVLKFPVMLFAFPYFLLLVGILISRIPSTDAVLMGLLLVCGVSTVEEKDLFGNRHYALFKEVGLRMADWRSTYGADNIYTIYNLNNPDYINFYVDEWEGDSIDFDWDVLEFNSDYELYQALKNRTEEYCVVGYSSRLTLVQVFETALHFYPEVVDFERYNNGTVYLLKKGNQRCIDRHETVITHFPSTLDNEFGNWFYNSEQQVEKLLFRLDSTHQYGPNFEFSAENLPNYEGYLMVEVSIDQFENNQLTVALTGQRNGKTIEHRNEPMWIGHDLEGMLATENKAFFAFKVPPYIQEEDILKISLWNRNGTPLDVTEIQITYVQNVWND